jgi:dTDP-4-amino-4,6-dideoxygalactose transaminase
MINYGRHSINRSDIRAVVKVLQSDFLTMGPGVEKFESELETVVGAPCVSVSSGTAALHCAYASLNLMPGDEIITPPITFIATQAAAIHFGAKIVFADISEDTATLNPELVENLITDRTRAIVTVDYAGHPSNLDALRKIADRYNLYLIEDAAHAFGSTYESKPVGSISDLTLFSFFPTKNITTGEGGAVASIHPNLLENVKLFARQGVVRKPQNFKNRNEGPWYNEVQSFGLNYRLPEILCALGSSQIQRLAKFRSRRSEIFSRYSEAFSSYEFLQVPTKKENVNVNWHFYPLRVPAHIRYEIFMGLRQMGINAQVNYIPVYRHPVFQKFNFRPQDFPISENFYSREISLPLHYELKDRDVNRIIKAVLSLIETA